MEHLFSSAEWLRMSPAERVEQCRLLAHEASELALMANSRAIKRGYLDLALQWETLAREIEQGEK
jgi:hypothetical protein